MRDLVDAVDAAVRESRFSGVVRVSAGGVRVLEGAYGFADRRHAARMRPDTQLAIASGTKALTAVTTMSLIQEGLLTLGTSVRTLLGDDLPLVGDAVTVEHLLAHRSGIGDYLDESEGLDRNAYLMPVPVHEFACTADYLPVLDGHPPKFSPGSSFSYCNAGYVVLALVLERVAGAPFQTWYETGCASPPACTPLSSCAPTSYRGAAATGYLPAGVGLRTNVFHLPVLGSGDGGDDDDDDDRIVTLEGYDAGVSSPASTTGNIERGEVDWRGHHADGSTFAMRGVIVATIHDGQIAAARLYVEPVELSGADIEAAVEHLYRLPPKDA